MDIREAIEIAKDILVKETTPDYSGFIRFKVQTEATEAIEALISHAQLSQSPDKEKKVRGILNDLCHNTMGNPPYRIDQATTAILKLMEGKE